MNSEQTKALVQVAWKSISKEWREKRLKEIHNTKEWKEGLSYIEEIISARKEIDRLYNKISSLELKVFDVLELKKEEYKSYAAPNFRSKQDLLNFLISKSDYPKEKDIKNYVSLLTIKEDVDIDDIINKIKNHFLN